MPTLLNWKGHKFLFYSKEPGEPPHIHVIKDRSQVKIWLADLSITKHVGFTSHEINAILRETANHREEFLEAWNEYFGN